MKAPVAIGVELSLLPLITEPKYPLMLGLTSVVVFLCRELKRQVKHHIQEFLQFQGIQLETMLQDMFLVVGTLLFIWIRL